MVGAIIYIFILILELLFFISFSIYTLFLIYSNFKGAPYVPTKNIEIDAIFNELKLKKGQIMYDLGCGDGRVIRKASQKFGIKGIGVDLNPLVLLKAKFWTKKQKIKNIQFFCKNIFAINLANADVVYIFLMPNIMKNLAIKMEKELKKGVLVISHGFKIIGWEKYCYKTLDHKPFPTYSYQYK